ncbi:Hypothetical protein SSCIU_01621 [Mammaliicoccus sciuri]|nr:Hypothetical protein SSCIU_01621 [Mammaliicoccus sciuri]
MSLLKTELQEKDYPIKHLKL